MLLGKEWPRETERELERGKEREGVESVICVGKCHMIERAEREFCFLLQEMPKCTRFMKTEGSEKVK